MAPSLVLQPGGISTRSKTSLGGLSLRSGNISVNSKRKQEHSPPKGGKSSLKRRPALGELTNAAALRIAATKKGSNTDLSNLKAPSKTNIANHHDIVKPKSKITQTTTTRLTNNTKTDFQNTTKNTITSNAIDKTVKSKVTSNSTTNVKQQINKVPLPVTKLAVCKPKYLTNIRNSVVNKTNKNLAIKTNVNQKTEEKKIDVNIRRESLRSHRRSSGIKSDESSLYVSALEELDVTHSNGKKTNNRKSDITKQSSKAKQTPGEEKKEKSLIEHFDKEIRLEEAKSSPPPGVVDFDKETWDDPIQVSSYAMDIFEYLKGREAEFKIKDYLKFQNTIDKGKINAEMRMVLVDWMVEVQETFELNHETLYLSVKLVDLFLSKSVCTKESLQLLGAVAIFIASKFDDRIPPQLSDLSYICSHTYSIQDLKDMEIKLITSVGFDLGIPLSYRFLRRYARCNRIQLPLLTLARYILELSLMEYSLIFESDSKMACASLYLAQKMSNLEPWNKTLQYYTGYKVEHFQKIVIQLNRLLLGQPRTVMMQSLSTVFKKYSHSIFFEVAKTPLVKEQDLFS